MPSPFVQRMFRVHATYHVYNRGAHKLPIFREESDYWHFRWILRQVWECQESPPVCKAYCLMPNHFHFELFQEDDRAISAYMKSAWTRYTIYFRKKYEHSGCLCQGPYKAVWLRTRKKRKECRLYILNNPTAAGLKNWPHVGKCPW